MVMPILQTKLYIPPSRPQLAHRPRLDDLLNAGLRCKLTLFALLTGNEGIPAEFAMIAGGAPLASTTLRAGHHSSSGSTSAPFVRAVNLQVAVIQCGLGDEYGHPRKEVRYNLAGRTVLRSDLNGRVHICSDDKQMWLDTETNSPVVW